MSTSPLPDETPQVPHPESLSYTGETVNLDPESPATTSAPDSQPLFDPYLPPPHKLCLPHRRPQLSGIPVSF